MSVFLYISLIFSNFVENIILLSYGKIRQRKRDQGTKKALNQEKRKVETLEKKYSEEKFKNKLLKCDSKKKARELLLSSLSEKERELVELLFPDTDTEK